MQVISNLDELSAKITECNDVLTREGDDAMRRHFETFHGDFSGQAPKDPFSPEYRAFQLHIHERIAGKIYSPQNERTHFDVAAYRGRPYPYYLKSLPTAGDHLLAVGFMLRMMNLPPGARVVEFGPGWGNTTIAMAMLGLQVTAVDIEPNFCAVLRERAALHELDINVVEGDFFWAEGVTEPYDAAVFFEAFHHCDDHMRLLRALRTAVKPDGQVIFGAEPVVPNYPMPWGVSMHGVALWAMRNFGWLELGFDEAYFQTALARTGWTAEKHKSNDLHWATSWRARRMDPAEEAAAADMTVPAPPPEPPVASPPVEAAPSEASTHAGPTEREAQLERELAALHASTSWRVTALLRRLRRLLG